MMTLPGRRPVVWWRLGLLLALGGTIVFASISYDDWRLLGRYLGSEVWHGASRRAAMARASREGEERVAREREEAHVDGSIRGLFAGSVEALAHCPDGGLVVGGTHSSHGLALARIRADGTLDRTWADRMAAQPIVGSVGSVSCDQGGILVSGSLLSHRGFPGEVTAARFSPDGVLERVYEGSDRTWQDASRGDRIVALDQRVEQRLPKLSDVRSVFAGPGLSAIAFFDERIPEPEEPEERGETWMTFVDVTGRRPRTRRVQILNFGYCATGMEPRERRVSRVALFDRTFALRGTPPAPTPERPETAHPQFDDRWIVRRAGRDTRDGAVLWRATPAGRDPSFEELLSGDLGGGLVLASLVEPDGSIVIGGTFETVRGRPRRHIARLSADGGLAE